MRERVSQWTSSVSAPIRQALGRLTQMARTFHPGMLGLITGVIVVGLALLILVLRDRIGLWAATHVPINAPAACDSPALYPHASHAGQTRHEETSSRYSQ